MTQTSGAGPSVSIASPKDGTNTTGGYQTPITGKITSSTNANWEMDYQQVTTDNGYATGAWIPFAHGSVTGSGNSQTVTGNLDTTLLTNGEYCIQSGP